MRRSAVAAVVLVLAVGCPALPAGPVQAKDRDCTGGDRPVCTYQLKVDGEWFEVVKATFDRCDPPERYPECAER